MLLRLNKFLSMAGVESRRKAEELIKAGVVKVNGEVCTSLSKKIDPQKDIVKVNEKRVKLKEPLYYSFYKPKGVVSTLFDPEGRKCIGDFIKTLPKGIKPVGRLDFYSEGLMFLTNDGDWAQSIQHPKFKVKKVYYVKVQGEPDQKAFQRWIKGMVIDGKFQKMEFVKKIKKTEGNHTWLEIHLFQGYTHQIKKMCGYLGFPAEKIKRVAIGNFKLKDLKPGEFRKLKKEEIESLIKGGKNEGSRKH
ncbi:MAG: pseudouridine synthase [Thermoanaerobaculia bacterium]